MSDNISPFQGSAIPYLCTHDTAGAIAFYQQAFGAVEAVRMTDDQGRISHAEIRIAGAPVYLADEHPEIDVYCPHTIGGSPVLIVLEVEDVDTLFPQAVAAGAMIERPLADAFGGAHRNGKLIDPYGHHWLLLTIRSPLTREQLQA
jgi:PhnB protein